MGNRRWTNDEIQYLEDSWGAKSIPTIAKNLNRTQYSISTFENNGIPIKLKKSKKKKYKIIYIKDFWKWAENHKNLLNFKRFESGTLGWPEPSWVDKKRQSDKAKAKNKKSTPWTDEEDKQLKWLLDQYKYGYADIARIIGRTEGAVKRRCYDLKLKVRPLKAENHRKWEKWETDLLLKMYNNGYTYEDICKKLNNRSVQAARGKIERELGLYKKDIV